jgi:hypothetical protein
MGTPSCPEDLPLFSVERRGQLTNVCGIMLAATQEVKFKVFIVWITDPDSAQRKAALEAGAAGPVSVLTA